MNKIIIKFLIFIFILLLNNSVFSSSGKIIDASSGSIQTISELKGNLKELNNEKRGLNTKLIILKGNKRLNGLLRRNLTPSEINDIIQIVNTYKKINIKLNNILENKSKKLEDITDIRKKLVKERINFYKKLVKYIDKKKLTSYKNYVKSDTQILRDKKEINAKINKNKQLLKNKVTKIKEEIKVHDEILNKKLKIIIEKKLEEKILNLKNNEKFRSLSNNIKKEILLKTIKKINIKIDNLKKSFNNNNIILKKIEIYNMAITKIKQLYKEY